MPFWSDSATFSAACRHTEQDRNSASPSFHSLLWRSNVRGVDAIRKLATAAPDGVKRRSGSSTRLPMMVMVVSPAMGSLPRRGQCQSVSPVSSVNGGTEDLGPHHGLVQAELTVELV